MNQNPSKELISSIGYNLFIQSLENQNDVKIITDSFNLINLLLEIPDEILLDSHKSSLSSSLYIKEILKIIKFNFFVFLMKSYKSGRKLFKNFKVN